MVAEKCLLPIRCVAVASVQLFRFSREPLALLLLHECASFINVVGSRHLILLQLGLLVIHVAASAFLLLLEFDPLGISLFLLLSDLLLLLLEPDQSELSDFLLNALFSFHLLLLVGGEVLVPIGLGNGTLGIGVAAGAIPLAHMAYSSLALGDGLQDDVPVLVGLLGDDEAGR